MIVSIVRNRVKAEGISEYIDIASRFMQDMRLVEGCINAYLLRDEKQKNVIINMVVWQSQEYMEKGEGNVFLKYKAELKKYFLGNESETLNVIQ